MIVQKRTTVGPGTSLTFNGGSLPVGIHSLKIYGRSEQVTTPTESSPVAITSVASSGSMTIYFTSGLVAETYTFTFPSGLKGLKIAPGGYLIGNDMYLMNNLGQKLKAKIN